MQQHGERPVGLARPDRGAALWAWRALDERRVDDAMRHVGEIEGGELSDLAWAALIEGSVATQHLQFTMATDHLHRALSFAFASSVTAAGAIDSMSLRLAACAMQRLGLVHRRRERIDEAHAIHLAAYRLRERYGSLEECWESTIELGLDCHVARTFDEAIEWHRTASQWGSECIEEPVRKQAVAHTHLSRTLTDAGQLAEAVVAARQAQTLWHQHDLGAATAAQADLNLGSVLLTHGLSLHEVDDAEACKVLEEAVSWLTSAGEGLSAFGADHAAEVETSREQLDFAQHLIEG